MHTHAEAPPVAATDQIRVDTPDPALVAAEKRHELPRALREGTEAMRKRAHHWQDMRPLNGELSIVPLARGHHDGWEHMHGEAFTVYDLRVESSVLPDVWMSTIEQAASLPFANKIQLTGYDVELAGEDVTDAEGKFVKRITGWVDNIDGEGQTFDQWAAGAYLESMANGIDFGFTDMGAETFETVAARQAARARPHLTMLKRSDLVWMVLERTGPGQRIAAVAFKQPIAKTDFSDPDNRAIEKTRAIKVVIAGRLDPDADGGAIPVTTQTWVETEDDKKQVSFVRDLALDSIIRPPIKADWKGFIDVPLRPLYGRRTGPWTGESPYIRTAPLAAEIWRLSSLASHASTELLLAYLFETGVPAGSDDTGGTNATPIEPASTLHRYRSSTQPNARLTWAQQDAVAVKAMDARVKDKILELAKAHRAMDSDRTSGPVTAREITVESVHSNGELETRVVWHEGAWNQILLDFAILGGHSKRGRATISHDFGLPSDDIDRLTELFKLNKVRAANYWPEAKRHNMTGEDFDQEIEIDAEKEQEGRLDAPEPPESGREFVEPEEIPEVDEAAEAP